MVKRASQLVARIERQRNAGPLFPDFASLNPGY
jgi:hypothetical protein